MKRCVLWLLCLWYFAPLGAQQLPAEWLKYSANTNQYFYEIRTDHNTKGGSESIFCENLRQSAIVGLAQQLEVQVGNSATTNKSAHDGQSHTTYYSTSTLSTKVDLQLVQTDIRYNRSTGEGMAIAWVNKQEARSHYLNNLQQIFGKVEGHIKIAQEYSATGYDKQALAEFESAQARLKECDGYVSRLSLFGMDGATVGNLLERCTSLRLTIEQGLKESRHGRSIYFVCKADLLGTPYSGLGGKIKGGLSAEGCNFTASEASADWSVVIEAAAREQQVRNVGGMSIYTTYVDALITITNIKTAQVVCSDEVSVKGSHTISYADAARTAYNEAKDDILQTIKTYIN